MGKVEHLVQLLGRVALGKVETGRNSARTSARLRGASNNGRGQKRNGGRRLLVHVHLKINEFLHDPVKSYKGKEYLVSRSSCGDFVRHTLVIAGLRFRLDSRRGFNNL